MAAKQTQKTSYSCGNKYVTTKKKSGNSVTKKVPKTPRPRKSK